MFTQSGTQQMMVEMADRLLAKEFDFETRRHRLSGDAPDRLSLWPTLAAQGLLAAFASERLGGLGGSARDLCSIMAVAGKYLVVEPLLHTAIVLHALDEADDNQASLAEQIMSGQHLVVFAHQEAGDSLSRPACRAQRDGRTLRLDGEKSFIRHADLADSFLVSANLDGGTALLLVNARSSGIHLDITRGIDSSSVGNIEFEGASATMLLRDAEIVCRQLLSLQLIGLAAEAAGIALAANKQTFAYLTTRQQFGSPLSGFQALQHRSADMHIAAEEARAITARAADLFDAGSKSGLQMAIAAKAKSDTVLRRVGNDAVQLHGGMGVSDELIVSHQFKRLAAIRSEGGLAEDLRAHLVRTDLPMPLTEGESVEIAQFRLEVRDFTQTYLPHDIARKGELGIDLQKDDYVRWQKILGERGWFAASWPREHGGAGWGPEQQLVMLQETALYNAPMIIPYGVSMVGPVLQTFGSTAQQERHLPGILSSDVWWCQGYSEPNSGSDLASLKTSAARDGDNYIVNGTKMWTTEAHWADWMHCLVRTNKEGKPQAGISFLLIDMKSPGIDIRPIVTIDGQHHTNQIFLDNLRVPVENLVAAEGEGWTIAKFLLAHERVAIADTGPKIRLLGEVKKVFAALDATGAISPARKVILGDRIAEVDCDIAALVSLEQDYVRQWAMGVSKNGPEASVLKVRGTEILQSIGELALAVEGAMSFVHDPELLHRLPDSKPAIALQASAMAHQYLYGRCWSIFGGTNEVQRNIIAGAMLR